MEAIYDSAVHAPRRRGEAWREALCGRYVTVEARLDEPDAYFGAARAAEFGEVILSETWGAGQVVTRDRRHLARLDKDCCYVQMPDHGVIAVHQRGRTIRTDPGAGSVYAASEPYRLDCIGVTRATFLEIPRPMLAAALGEAAGGAAGGRRGEAAAGAAETPVTAGFSTLSGMGRVLADFCRTLKAEAAGLDAAARAALAPQLVALTALAIAGGELTGAAAGERGGLRAARLAAAKAHVEAHLADPLLSLAAVAQEMGISVRYLHRLFEEEETSASGWIWARRLERSRQALADAGPGDTVTDIAYSVGFNSSSHFSTAFRARFGMRPSEVLRARQG